MKRKKLIWGLVIFISLFLLVSIVFMMVRISGAEEIAEKEKGVLRFATYNMMFGMYGREGVINGLGHLSFHGLHSKFLTKIFSRLNAKTVELVGGWDADFVSLNEVLGTLKKGEIIEGLKEEGFGYFCWGAAAHHDKPLDLGTLFASKYKFEELNFTLPQKNHMGGGGGACAVFVEEKNLSILALHLGRDRELQEKQVEKISLFVREQSKKKRKVVLMGDFNLEVNELVGFEDFKSLNLSVVNYKDTAPNIDEVKLFYFEGWDNIFYKGSLKLKNSGIVDGLSDHKVVWADFGV